MRLDEVEFPPPERNFCEDSSSEDDDLCVGKTPVKTVLRFGIDIDGTISRAPRHFKRLIDALLVSGNLVYIITGRDAGRRDETEQFLGSLAIRYTSLIMKPIDWEHHIADYKVAVAKEKDLHMMIDDEEVTCWAIETRTRALAAHMLPAPPVLEEFEPG